MGGRVDRVSHRHRYQPVDIQPPDTARRMLTAVHEPGPLMLQTRRRHGQHVANLRAGPQGLALISERTR